MEVDPRGRDIFGETYTLLLRHRGCGWSAVARARVGDLQRHVYDSYSAHAVPVFEVGRVATDKNLFVEHSYWDRVDLSAGFRAERERKSVRDLGIFNPWVEPEREEIIVRPDSVAELMDRIRQLQEPELREIRERNRRRELREQTPELVCAQIISFDGRQAA